LGQLSHCQTFLSHPIIVDHNSQNRESSQKVAADIRFHQFTPTCAKM
jgi:hypothetical protein